VIGLEIGLGIDLGHINRLYTKIPSNDTQKRLSRFYNIDTL